MWSFRWSYKRGYWCHCEWK